MRTHSFIHGLARIGAIVCVQLVLITSLCSAETEEELRAKRDYWQDKYRVLLHNRAAHQENAARMKYAHEQAQLSNYPRGGARERLLVAWKESLAKADAVQREIDGIFDEARRAGIPPGWLYEVEDEPIVLENEPTTSPAARADADEDDSGRNPLYLKSGED